MSIVMADAIIVYLIKLLHNYRVVHIDCANLHAIFREYIYGNR